MHKPQFLVEIMLPKRTTGSMKWQRIVVFNGIIKSGGNNKSLVWQFASGHLMQHFSPIQSWINYICMFIIYLITSVTMYVGHFQGIILLYLIYRKGTLRVVTLRYLGYLIPSRLCESRPGIRRKQYHGPTSMLSSYKRMFLF